MEVDCTRVILVTANVGSIFEEPETMFSTWLKAFFQCVQTHKPGLVALHCQEVGGKNYKATMQHVTQFIQMLLACEELLKYHRARIFLDEDYSAADKFTALGNIYFIHEDVTDVLIWDFVDCKFIEVEGREVLSGNIECVPIKEKAKFPQCFFPELKWSRKGFLRTRWSINNCIFDLVNIHLFHDDSNIVAMETSPSVYLENRQRTLLHTLQRFENDKYSKVPLFIFGDFNFRLDSYLLIQELTRKLGTNLTKGKKGLVSKIDYTELDTGKVVLTIGSKNFDYYDQHTDLFTSVNKWLHQYDTEFSSFQDQLFEYDITFPPSYPFCEDISDGISYMKTRVPSWCDRVLLTHSAKDIISQDPSYHVIYDLIGKDICMGDHKPAYLYIQLKPGKGNCEEEKKLSDASTTKSPSPLEHSISLSINGELCEGINISSADTDLSVVDSHDNAKFENENSIFPKLETNVKDKKGIDNEECGSHLTCAPSQVNKSRSFKTIARKVLTLESVLLQWRKKRSHSQHYGSSSKGFCAGGWVRGNDVFSNKAENSEGLDDNDVISNKAEISEGLDHDIDIICNKAEISEGLDHDNDVISNKAEISEGLAHDNDVIINKAEISEGLAYDNDVISNKAEISEGLDHDIDVISNKAESSGLTHDNDVISSKAEISEGLDHDIDVISNKAEISEGLDHDNDVISNKAEISGLDHDIDVISNKAEISEGLAHDNDVISNKAEISECLDHDNDVINNKAEISERLDHDNDVISNKAEISERLDHDNDVISNKAEISERLDHDNDVISNEAEISERLDHYNDVISKKAEISVGLDHDNDVISKKAEITDKDNISTVAHCSTRNVGNCVKDLIKQKENVINEANNNENNTTESLEENCQIKQQQHSESAFFDAGVQLENSDSKLLLDKSDGAFIGDGLSVGCGDGDRTVVLLAQHGGNVHGDSSASPTSSVSHLTSQSYQKEPQNGKTEKVMSAPSSPPNGCCSCMVL